jgi:hypothetical protein
MLAWARAAVQAALIASLRMPDASIFSCSRRPASAIFCSSARNAACCSANRGNLSHDRGAAGQRLPGQVVPASPHRLLAQPVRGQQFLQLDVGVVHQLTRIGGTVQYRVHLDPI